MKHLQNLTFERFCGIIIPYKKRECSMSDLAYIQRYSLKVQRKTPKVKLRNVRHEIAFMFGFRSWKDLVNSSYWRKKLIKALIRHPDILLNGFDCREHHPELTKNQWDELFADNMNRLSWDYGKIHYLSEWITGCLRPIKSINYKADYQSICPILKKAIKREFHISDDIIPGHFIHAMLLSDFHMVKSPDKKTCYFNVSQKSINEMKALNDRYDDIIGHGADYIRFDSLKPNGVYCRIA